MVKIGTHSGTFHCDEALGCWLLKHTERFADAEVVRSRDPEVLKDLDVVIDVGGVYDAAALRYDHHQRGFQEVFGHGFSTKLSSAGLVYLHHGREVLARLLGWPMDHPSLTAVWLEVYRTFVEAVDALDNGIHQWEGDAPPKYQINTDLGSRVGHLNPSWNEPQTDDLLYAQFLKAMALTGSEFDGAVHYIASSWLPGRAYVEEALKERVQVHESGAIMRLPRVCPWKEHLFQLEEELGIQGQVLLCLYEDPNEKKWRIQAVPRGPRSFESRRPLPAAWRGVRDAALSELSGIPGCVFVHAAGFIGGNATYEGALEMAQKALTME